MTENFSIDCDETKDIFANILARLKTSSWENLAYRISTMPLKTCALDVPNSSTKTYF